LSADNPASTNVYMNKPLEAQRKISPGDGKTPVLVEISINSITFSIERGNHTVEELRTLGSVPPNEILSELKNGKFHDLPNNAHVEIRGGEVFVSHPPSGGSSR
jgi:hypothetical protein